MGGVEVGGEAGVDGWMDGCCVLLLFGGGGGGVWWGLVGFGGSVCVCAV